MLFPLNCLLYEGKCSIIKEEFIKKILFNKKYKKTGRKTVLNVILKNKIIIFQKNAECKNCNTKRVIIRYDDKKDNISKQRKMYCEKNVDKTTHHQKHKLMHSKDLVRTHVDLVN